MSFDPVLTQLQATTFSVLPPAAAAKALAWVPFDDSLTVCLDKQSQGDLKHHLHRVRWVSAPQLPAESPPELICHTRFWERMIAFSVRGEAWLQARVLIPAPSLLKEGVALQYCGARSLGMVLFQDPGLRRVHVSCEVHEPDTAEWSFTRHGLYYFYGLPLLITETFLPPLLAKDPPPEVRSWLK